MPETADRFSHHPELQSQIADPLQSFFRDFNAKAFFEDKPELHWVIELLHSDSERAASRDETLAGRWDDDLWVFAYGSLMWDPAIQFSEVRRAHVPDYARRFILKDIYGGRGTPETPGLMAALDNGDGCDGLVFRIAKKDIETETEILWGREMIGPGYIPTFVPAIVEERTIEALTFVADHEAEAMQRNLTRQEQIQFITSGRGFLGSSLEYLANIVAHFTALGVTDEDCSALLGEAELSLKHD